MVVLFSYLRTRYLLQEVQASPSVLLVLGTQGEGRAGWSLLAFEE